MHTKSKPRGGKRENTRKKSAPTLSADGRFANAKALAAYFGKTVGWVRRGVKQGMPRIRPVGCQEDLFEIPKCAEHLTSFSTPTSAPEPQSTSNKRNQRAG